MKDAKNTYKHMKKQIKITVTDYPLHNTLSHLIVTSFIPPCNSMNVFCLDLELKKAYALMRTSLREHPRQKEMIPSFKQQLLTARYLESNLVFF